VNPEQEFPESFPLQVAVLWTATEDGPKTPLALVHVLKEMGIPFFVTGNLNQALKHRMVILYPEVGPRTFSEAQAQQLQRFKEASARYTRLMENSDTQNAYQQLLTERGIKYWSL